MIHSCRGLWRGPGAGIGEPCEPFPQCLTRASVVTERSCSQALGQDGAQVNISPPRAIATHARGLMVPLPEVEPQSTSAVKPCTTCH
jgi:hypothetical protein